MIAMALDTPEAAEPCKSEFLKVGDPLKIIPVKTEPIAITL
jgi:hypothetical protein